MDVLKQDQKKSAGRSRTNWEKDMVALKM